MAFNFGGAAPAQPAATPAFGGFGAAASGGSTFGGFGATATTQPATGFGGFGASATTQASTGFGGFGATATTQPSTGFGGFGATATTQATPGFGGGFGAAATTQANTGFGGFGATTQANTGFGGFGAAATTQASTGFGGFGAAAAPATQTSTGFGGFGGFGAAATSQPNAGFSGFGASTQASTGFGGFGAAAAKPAFGATSTFGGTSGGLFGATNTNTGFGAAQPTGGLFGGGGAFGAQQQQQQQQQLQQQPSALDALYTAVLHCSLYGDERDAIVARWNMLQASWGAGKAFYSNNAPPVDLKPDNPFCRFKAIGYSAIPKHKNEDGFVSLSFRKKATELESGKDALVTSISGVLGNKPNIKVSVESVKATGADTADAVITVQEKAASGAVRKVPASEMHSFLTQPGPVQQLKNIGVENVVAKLQFSPEDIKEYLANPPSGIDARLWKQAQLDNPDSKTLLPVPMIGFKSLQQRIKSQETQTKSHQGRLDLVAEDIASLQRSHQDTLAALGQAKRRQLELSHRLLKVLVRQESTRKLGFTIQPEEETLRGQLETLQAELATPTQFKGRLNELLSQVRLQSQAHVMSGGDKYQMDQFAIADIKAVLTDQQGGIQALVGLVKEDMRDLATVMEGLALPEQKV